MKTLKELSLDTHKTSNYADHINKMVCCGWMEIHEDSYSLGIDDNPIFTVKPLFWDDEAVFIIKIKDKWRGFSKSDFLSKKKTVGIKLGVDTFSFNAERYHALLPAKLAEKLIINSDFENSEEYKSFAKKCSESMSPKLVWEFVKAL